MKKPEEFTPAIAACLQNAEKMIAAAKACAQPGSYHLAFHMATMALEEIGKSSMIFLDALDRKPVLPGEENRSPLKWVEDHERKLFWAIWVPSRESLESGKQFPLPWILRAESTRIGLKRCTLTRTIWRDRQFLSSGPKASSPRRNPTEHGAAEFTAMVKDFLQIADHMIANKMAPRALTLDDVIRAKMVFDVYIRLKAQRAYMEEVAKMKGAKPAIPIDAIESVDKS
jgi:AbiV family abortive infection protein